MVAKEARQNVQLEGTGPPDLLEPPESPKRAKRRRRRQKLAIVPSSQPFLTRGGVR